MGENKRYGRDSLPRRELTEDDKARIRSEEEVAYREQIRAKLTTQSKRPSFPASAVLAGSAVAIGLLAWAVWPKPQVADPLPTRQSASPQVVSSAPPSVPTDAAIATLKPEIVRERCAANVRDQLKAPATAQFNDTKNPKFDENQWMWTSYVDAQNSYGALIRSDFRCLLTGTTASNSIIRAELADADGAYESDKRAQEATDEVNAAMEAEKAINLCLTRIREKYPTPASRNDAILTSCFGPNDLITMDEELNFRYIIGLDIDTGINGDDLQIQAETVDGQKNNHSWTWDNGSITQDY